MQSFAYHAHLWSLIPVAAIVVISMTVLRYESDPGSFTGWFTAVIALIFITFGLLTANVVEHSRRGEFRPGNATVVLFIVLAMWLTFSVAIAFGGTGEADGDSRGFSLQTFLNYATGVPPTLGPSADSYLPIQIFAALSRISFAIVVSVTSAMIAILAAPAVDQPPASDVGNPHRRVRLAGARRSRAQVRQLRPANGLPLQRHKEFTAMADGAGSPIPSRRRPRLGASRSSVTRP